LSFPDLKSDSRARLLKTGEPGEILRKTSPQPINNKIKYQILKKGNRREINPRRI
jgi:hypothetical protein